MYLYCDIWLPIFLQRFNINFLNNGVIMYILYPLAKLPIILKSILLRTKWFRESLCTYTFIPKLLIIMLLQENTDVSLTIFGFPVQSSCRSVYYHLVLCALSQPEGMSIWSNSRECYAWSILFATFPP